MKNRVFDMAAGLKAIAKIPVDRKLMDRLFLVVANQKKGVITQQQAVAEAIEFYLNHFEMSFAGHNEDLRKAQ